MSEPFLRSTASPPSKCVQNKLIPLKIKHSDDNYMFWTDKALAHYVKSVTQLLDSRNVRNVPQCRPIEQFFKCLSTSLQESLESSKH